METGVHGIDPQRILRAIADRQDRRSRRDGGQAFRRALEQRGGPEDAAGSEAVPDPEPPLAPRLQPRGPAVRRDPSDGSLHVDLLA